MSLPVMKMSEFTEATFYILLLLQTFLNKIFSDKTMN